VLRWNDRRRSRLLALAVSVGVAVGGVPLLPVRAEEVPPSPVPPPPSPLSSIPGNLVGSGDVDGGVVVAQGACGLVLELVGGGQRQDVCTQARPESHCKTIRLDPNITGTHDTIVWRPYIDLTDCYIRRGTTLTIPFRFRVTSSRTGDRMNDSSQYVADSDTAVQHMTSQWGEYHCDRTVGTLDQLTFQWDASAGGASTQNTIVVPCN
jgi:hypothetical protein